MRAFLLDTLYDKHVTCLYCNQSFITKRMRISKIKTKKKDSDFCTYFIGENPIFYEFYVCPFCGLAFTDGFSQIKGAAKDFINNEYISKVAVPDLCGIRSLDDALRGYKLTLLCANILNEKKIILANLCTRIAWLYRYIGKLEEELRFLQNAVDIYEEIYQTQSLENMPIEVGKLLYLVGELHSRLGHYETTRQWFSYVLTAKHIDHKWKSFVRNRWYDIKTSNILHSDDPEGYQDSVK